MTFDELDDTLCGMTSDAPFNEHRKHRRYLIGLAIQCCPESGNLEEIGGTRSDWRNVLHKRVTHRYHHENHGMGILASFVVSLLINLVVRLIIDWWFNDRSEATATIHALRTGKCDGT